MDTVLGLFGMALWIVGTIGLATGVTYLIVKIFPGDDDLKPKSES